MARLSLSVGDRVLFVRNGVQQAGTIKEIEKYEKIEIISDINGRINILYGDKHIIRKLEGIEAAKVEDIVVDKEGYRVKILAIDNQHNAFLPSLYNDFLLASSVWFAFAEAKNKGWKLKDEKDNEETIEIEGKKYTVSEIKEALEKSCWPPGGVMGRYREG